MGIDAPHLFSPRSFGAPDAGADRLPRVNRAIFDLYNVWLTLETTNLCNMRCPMCNVHQVDPNTAQMMDLDLYRSVLDDVVANRLRIFGLKLFWLGEPLVHPQFPEILRLIPAKAVNETVAFDSNCSYLTEEVTDALLDRARDCKIYLFCSLDAITPETYGKMRVGGDFEQTYRNLHHLLSERKRRGLAFPKVRLQFICHPLNRHEARDFVDHWRAADYWDASTREPLPIMDAIQDDRDFLHLRKWITHPSLQRDADRIYGEVLAEFGVTKHDMPMNAREEIHEGARFPCENLWAMPMVRVNGDVTVCNNDLELSLRIGNVREQPFSEIWSGPAVHRLRELHMAGRSCEIEKCRTCTSPSPPFFRDSYPRYLETTGRTDLAPALARTLGACGS